MWLHTMDTKIRQGDLVRRSFCLGAYIGNCSEKPVVMLHGVGRLKSELQVPASLRRMTMDINCQCPSSLCCHFSNFCEPGILSR
jgi:hypothetical protein